jgi:predicted  nucleic acid-binding Zn-ribbon protein
MEENKITKEELDNILQFQNRLYSLSTDVGILETQKHALLHELAGVNNEQEEYKKVLEEKYGKININLEDGTFEELKEDE